LPWLPTAAMMEMGKIAITKIEAVAEGKQSAGLKSAALPRRFLRKSRIAGRFRFCHCGLA